MITAGRGDPFGDVRSASHDKGSVPYSSVGQQWQWTLKKGKSLMNSKMRALCVATLWIGTLPAAGRSVALITDPAVSGPAIYGQTVLKQALQDAGHEVRRSGAADYYIVAGLAHHAGPAARMVRASNAPLPSEPEALTIRRSEMKGRQAFVLCGADDRGLM